jgi:hypothetical protein
MIKSAIEKIVSLAPDSIVSLEDGRKYWAKSGNPVIRPNISPICEVTSLYAMISAFDSKDLNNNMENIQVIVDNERHVSVRSFSKDPWQQRDVFITARYSVEPYPFGSFISIEDAIIKMMCLFVDSEKKSLLIAHLSSICSEEILTSLDDGISQAVTVEKRTGRKDRATIDPIIELAPFRTFTEVDQPTSRFLIRMQNVKGDRPVVALFEADGGAWRAEACVRVAAYLRSELNSIDVHVPVIG